MKRFQFLAVFVAATVTAWTAPGLAQDAPARCGVVSHVMVLSDKVIDVSSLDAWKQAVIRPSMSDREKALAAWRTVVSFQHQDSPPREFLHYESDVLDPIKLFNVYGYSLCSVASSHVTALARYLGLEARGWTIRAHCVPEVFWDGAWHMLDASLINYFPKPDGQIASIAEISGAVRAWLGDHPGMKGNDQALRKFHQADGWTGWLGGPALLTTSPFYDQGGWWPAATHGWYATMQEYDGSTLMPYESGFSQGYQVNIQLRPGLRLTRNWSNKGLHVNMPGDPPGCLKGRPGYDSMRYTPKYGDIAPGRVGNGTIEYTVPLGSGELALSALAYENLAPTPAGQLAPKDPAKDGVLQLRMPSSYVYLTGQIQAKAALPAGASAIVQFSDNNGLDWKDAATIAQAGPVTIDLTKLVFRRYDYRLRFVLRGGAGLDALRIDHDIQHSQRPLPALGAGKNTITFSAAPPEGTITIEGSLHPDQKARQLVYTDFHPQVQGLAAELLRVEGKMGHVDFPIQTPGEMTRLRFGCFYRVRDAKDRWDLQVSFDEGRTFRPAATVNGPKVAATKWVTIDQVPPGTKKAIVRYAGTQVNTACLMTLRIDADYREPAGGFRPVKITYSWDEAGAAKTDVHVARQSGETYEIHCTDAPRMKSIVLELE